MLNPLHRAFLRGRLTAARRQPMSLADRQAWLAPERRPLLRAVAAARGVSLNTLLDLSDIDLSIAIGRYLQEQHAD